MNSLIISHWHTSFGECCFLYPSFFLQHNLQNLHPWSMASFFGLISSKLCGQDQLQYCDLLTRSLEQFRNMLTQSVQCRNRGRCHRALIIIVAHDWICPIRSDVDSRPHRFCRLFFHNSHNVALIRSLATKIAPIKKMSATGDRREIVVIGRCDLIAILVPRTPILGPTDRNSLQVVASLDAAPHTSSRDIPPTTQPAIESRSSKLPTLQVEPRAKRVVCLRNGLIQTTLSISVSPFTHSLQKSTMGRIDGATERPIAVSSLSRAAPSLERTRRKLGAERESLCRSAVQLQSPS